MLVDGFYKDIRNILSFLDDGIEVLIVSATDPETLASVCHDFFVSNDS